MLTLEMPRRTKPLCRHCGPATGNPAVTPLLLCDTCERNYEVRELYVSESVKRSREPEGDFPATEAECILRRARALKDQEDAAAELMAADKLVRECPTRDFSKKIIAVRLAFDLSIQAFARELGVNRRTVRRWEAGVTPVPIGQIVKIAKRFQVPFKRFFQ